jgi:TPR repeat protein
VAVPRLPGARIHLAVYWYQKAASEGLTLAQANLGRLYYNGLGVMKDYSEAMRWFRMAADQGFASAENQVGYSYAIGLSGRFYLDPRRPLTCKLSRTPALDMFRVESHSGRP